MQTPSAPAAGVRLAIEAVGGAEAPWSPPCGTWRALGSDATSVSVVVAGLAERLNEVGHIVPGLGDAGDRLFGVAQ